MNLQIKRAFRSQALDFWVHRIIMRYPDCTYSGSWIVISWFLHTIFFGWNSFSFHVEFSSQVSFTSCMGLPRISATLWQPTDPESFLMHTTSMDRAGPLIIMQPSRNLNWLRGTSQLGQGFRRSLSKIWGIDLETMEIRQNNRYSQSLEDILVPSSSQCHV